MPVLAPTLVTARSFRAAPKLNRADWKAHPKFPKQTLLLGSHENFRRLSRELIDDAGSRGDGRSLALIENLFFSWQAAMQSHERYEEHKLYPYLVHVFGVDVSSLHAGHQALEQLRRDVKVAFEEGDRTFVAAALRAFDRRLLAHLAEEEELVIPLLLALTEDEFYRFTHAPLSQLLRS